MFNFIDWCNLFFQHYLRSLSAKNANHLQTTDTIKRHQRYSIHYHCGWPSLGIWGSATHYCLPALPEPFLRACGLHKAQKNQSSRAVYDVQGGSMCSILLIGATYFFNITKTVSPIIKKRVELHQKSSRRKTKWFSSYFRFPTSHTTVRVVPHTAVPYLTCSMT